MSEILPIATQPIYPYYLHIKDDNADCFLTYKTNQDIAEVEQGDILQVTNSLGYMKKGLALHLANKQPGLADWYKKEEKKLGEILVWNNYQGKDNLSLVNLIAQSKIGNAQVTKQVYLNYPALTNCLEVYRDMIADDDPLTKTYVPYKMGCGLAGGNWSVVLRLLVMNTKNLVICVPNKSDK